MKIVPLGSSGTVLTSFRFLTLVCHFWAQIQRKYTNSQIEAGSQIEAVSRIEAKWQIEAKSQIEADTFIEGLSHIEARLRIGAFSHMSQIAEELTFAVLRVTKFENSRCSWEFSKVSQKAKVASFLSAWPSGLTTMSFGHRGCLINTKNGLFKDHFEFFWKKFENRQYCFPNFSMKTAPSEKTKYTET